MRKSLLILLLASASPAFADTAASQDREQRRAARADSRAERDATPGDRRSERAESREERRSERREARERGAGADAAAIGQADRGDIETIRSVRHQRREQRREERAEERDDRTARPRIEDRGAGRDSVRDWRRDEREQLRSSRAGAPGSRPPRIRVEPPPQARPDRPAPPPTTVTAQHFGSPWRSSWRRDSRYDWWRWRDRNRWLFSLGFYFDPFGWGYRRYPIGWRLWPSYYDRNYWLHDPWMWRLPPSYGPYRWVRYWDDALMVNIYTGEVVDVIHDFFW